jgi:carboxypeptidase Q
MNCLQLILPLLLWTVTLTSTASAQTSPAAPPPGSILDREATLPSSETSAWTAQQMATMSRLRDAAMDDDYAYSQLAYLTDTIGPRLSGSEQAGAAVDRLAAQMRALGAVVTLEKTAVPHWIRGEETAALTAWPGKAIGTTQKIVLTALGNSVATPAAGITAPILVVDSYAQLQGLTTAVIKGKIVLFNRPFDKELTSQGQGMEAYIQNASYRYRGPSLAASLGAAAVLVRSLGSADFRLPHTGATRHVEGGFNVPAAAVAAEDAELLRRLAEKGTVIMRLTLTPRTLRPAVSYNVIADWKGAEHPEQVVIVSGHLDSWDLGTGAIDDGAGVVTAMEAIQLLQSMNIHPRRTVRFIAWMNEEFGAGGAATYGKEHAAEFTNHVAVMESDLGCDHPTGLLLSSPALKKYLDPIRETLEPIGAGVLKSVEEIPAEDLSPMIAAGVASLTPAQDTRFYFSYHHSAADTLDKVDKHHLAENAAVIVVTAYALADASTPAPRALNP